MSAFLTKAVWANKIHRDDVDRFHSEIAELASRWGLESDYIITGPFEEDE